MPIIFIIKEVGVTTKKKTKPITIGEIILPKKIPNLNQILFKGDKRVELNNPNNKKIIDSIKDQILISLPLNIGNIERIKKNIKKTIPKLLFDEIFIFLEFINFYYIIFLNIGIIYFFMLNSYINLLNIMSTTV